MLTPLNKIAVILVADPAPARSNLDLGRTDLELVEEKYLTELISALRSICSEVIHISDPSYLPETLRLRHQDVLVFPVWSGQRSRNRKGLVPAICEIYGTPYVGADAYAQLLCQDKWLSKSFAMRFGFNAPRSILLEEPCNVKAIEFLSLPLVVKPNAEGGSIGISQKSLVDGYAEALDLAKLLQEEFQQPILIEEFIAGREISIVMLGAGKEVNFIDAVDLVILEGGFDIATSLYSFEIKKQDPVPDFEYRLARDCMPPELESSSLALFRALNKVEVLRIDGRWHHGAFYMIELSPDVHYGSEGELYAAFMLNGRSYPELLERILSNCLQDQADRSENANKK